jgi:signal peptidase I
MFPWIFLALLVPFHYALYKLFPKAGQPAWAGLVPFYNIYIIQKKICKKPLYWIFFLILPGINLVMFGCILYNLARAYGKYTSKELFSAVVLFPYFFIKIANDKETVFVPKDKRPARKKSSIREWGEALIFAIIAATFIKGYLVEPYKIPTSSMEQDLLVGDFLLVSKLNYGLKIPQTPLTFPFTHNNLYDLPGPIWPFVKSYSTAWKIPLIKLPALEGVDRNEIVVFNFPANDTTIQTLELHAHDYYVKVAEQAVLAAKQDGKIKPDGTIDNWDYYMSVGRKKIRKLFPVTYHPVDKRNNYIKRCVAISGDKLEVRDGELYINDQKQEKPKNSQFTYIIKFKNNVGLNELKKYWGTEISPEDMGYQPGEDFRKSIDSRQPVGWRLTQDQYELIKNSNVADSIQLFVYPKTFWTESMYPHHPKFPWNPDHFGPLVVPKKGLTISLDENNYILYKRVIEAYEHHTSEWKGGQAYVDGKVVKEYTFRQNYYFMMGDNRHGSADSRCWGFVPNDHIVGKALLVVASTNDTGVKKFPNNIRWNRFFRLVH